MGSDGERASGDEDRPYARDAVEAELRDHKLRLQLAIETSALGVWSWDKLQDRIEWDERMLGFFELPKGGTPRNVEEYMALLPEDQRAVVQDHMQLWFQGVSSHYELRLDLSRGPRWFAVRGGAIKDAVGDVVGLVGVLADITESRVMEETLRQQQKMVATGQLSAGVAHNFNNMLAVILPALELAREEVPAPINRLLEDAIESASNAAQLVRDLMTFSKNSPWTESRREPLSFVVRRSVELCQRTFKKQVQFEVGDLEAANHCIVDSASMEHALMNLLLNARDALERVTERVPRIQVHVRLLSEKEGREIYPHGPGSCVELSVADNGVGMSEEVRLRIMEPFFTTKAAGEGTGLGLSTAWATLENHHGLLVCESKEGSGSRFIVVLPSQTGVVHSSPRSSRDKSDAAEGRVVLMIDDEPGVRRAMGYLLESAGYRVKVADCGIAGLEMADQGGVDLVLMDYSMPGLPAENVLVEIRDRLPGVPVVSMSGLGSTLEGADAYLTKPVQRDSLLATVHQVLASKRRLTDKTKTTG